MFKELLGDTCWKLSIVATAAVGTTTSFALNHVNLVCTILVSATAAAYTIVKIYKEIHNEKKEQSIELEKTAELVMASGEIRKQSKTLREASLENKKILNQLRELQKSARDSNAKNK